MNWGNKILIVIIVFIIGMGSMVYVAMQQKNEMIDDQYYVKELKHQGLIDAEKNLNELSEKLTITDTNNVVRISIPIDAANAISEGTIVFLRPSDKSKDKSFPLVLDSNGVQVISKDNFIKGLYKVRFSWNSSDKPFYTERSFFVN
jgi:archaellum component FlaF (FlaF/FlaG flagellin family)